jgi:hypothetical protein
MEEAEIDIKRAENKIKTKNGPNNVTRMKRTWLQNVDYKTGTLTSELKKKKMQELKEKREKRKAKRQKSSKDNDED